MVPYGPCGPLWSLEIPHGPLLSYMDPYGPVWFLKHLKIPQILCVCLSPILIHNLRNDQDWSGWIRTSKEWSELVRNDQDWLGMIRSGHE